jgi:FAD:protein FMN transferase
MLETGFCSMWNSRYGQIRLVFILMLISFWVTGCNFKKEVVFEGRTMGTTYMVKLATSYFNRATGLEEQINRRLAEINASMSTFLDDSEISRFNSLEEITVDFRISDDFHRVLTVAKKLFAHTDGAWDPSILPLVNIWGFGPKGEGQGIPEKAAIENARSAVGFQHIRLAPDKTMGKDLPAITLDLASIAKGYGVDAISRLLHDLGHTDFLVEIGGEVYAHGLRKDGNKWRVGINKPDPAAPGNQVYRTMALENMALATSGDYRNFFEIDGRRYSHVIDPRSGWPVANGVVSVSITADTCTLADGLATAVMVLGNEKGMAVIESLDGVEGIIVVRKPDESLVDYRSSGLKSASE